MPFDYVIGIRLDVDFSSCRETSYMYMVGLIQCMNYAFQRNGEQVDMLHFWLEGVEMLGIFLRLSDCLLNSKIHLCCKQDDDLHMQCYYPSWN